MLYASYDTTLWTGAVTGSALIVAGFALRSPIVSAAGRARPADRSWDEVDEGHGKL
jgi:hypothetical protein